ncbi:hypothetical protein J7F03_36955 [Streptomyces sp. ISL-43]|uniref:hypothetical protein n=1 Tax=Streptomyces sp. ISL-43 TaxID=2819183 RepID=UPI001BEC6BA4|nr:hypothetical protein [Streptomyces sp. ISL-43]MBT2452546.1 hypothetical protein [Streptomyces sp. ISL-43]
METDAWNAVIWTGISRDANYFGRFARDMKFCDDAHLCSAVSFCMAPYLSLSMYESLQKVRQIKPDILAAFNQETITISTRSRHSLKLFEDTKRGIDGQISYFRDEVFTAHAERFLGNTWIPWARRFEADLGLYRYGGRLITTTHAATFHLGFDPNRLLAQNPGPYIRSIFEEYGAYFGALGASLEDDGEPTFVRSLHSTAMNEARDVRSKGYYRRVFNGQNTPEINAILTTFRAMLNFAELVVASEINRQRLDYTAFKIGYLSLYQVLRSVRLLVDDADYPLSARSEQIASRLLDSPSVQLLTGSGGRKFRNMMVHYNLPSRPDVDKVDLSKFLYGLIPVYFPGFDDAAFVELVRDCGAFTAAAFDEWAEGS